MKLRFSFPILETRTTSITIEMRSRIVVRANQLAPIFQGPTKATAPVPMPLLPWACPHPRRKSVFNVRTAEAPEYKF